MLQASARLVAALENGSEAAIHAQYLGNLAHLSPVLCVESAVFRDEQILLIRRSDDGTWAMPGGLLEVGESPAQGAERELWEEAGVRGKALRLLGLYDTRIWPARSRMQLVIAQFLMQAEGDPGLHGTLQDGSSSLSETIEVGFFSEDSLPELHVGFDRRVPMAFRLWRSEDGAAFFDA